MKNTIHPSELVLERSLHDYITQRLNTLALVSDDLLSADVWLKLDKGEGRENKVCEMRLKMPGRDLFTSQKSRDFEQSVLLAMDVLLTQLMQSARSPA